MPNLEILDNVMHRGITLKRGIVLSDSAQGLSEVANDLIERGLAKATDAPATHTAAVVNGASEAMPIGSADHGTAPAAQTDDARRAEAEGAQVPATPDQQTQVETTAAQESTPVPKKNLLTKLRGDAPDATPVNPPTPVPPSPEDVAAAAESAA